MVGEEGGEEAGLVRADLGEGVCNVPEFQDDQVNFLNFFYFPIREIYLSEQLEEAEQQQVHLGFEFPLVEGQELLDALDRDLGGEGPVLLQGGHHHLHQDLEQRDRVVALEDEVHHALGPSHLPPPPQLIKQVVQSEHHRPFFYQTLKLSKFGLQLLQHRAWPEALLDFEQEADVLGFKQQEILDRTPQIPVLGLPLALATTLLLNLGFELGLQLEDQLLLLLYFQSQPAFLPPAALAVFGEVQADLPPFAFFLVR